LAGTWQAKQVFISVALPAAAKVKKLFHILGSVVRVDASVRETRIRNKVAKSARTFLIKVRRNGKILRNRLISKIEDDAEDDDEHENTRSLSETP